MALLTTHRLYIDATTGNAYRGWNDFSSVGTPILYHGDTEQVELYLVNQTTSAAFPMESVDFPSSTITVAVGTPGGTPVASGTSWSAVSSPSASWSSPTLTVPREATGGYYTLTLSNASPSLSATTASIQKGATTADISSAIVAAVNNQSGWSAASATVTQTGDGKFTITAKATNSSTVYTLTIAVTSSLTGASGYKGSVAMTGSGVGTLIGAATSVASTLEVQCNTGSGYQTYLQIPCLVRAQVTNP